MQIEKDTVVTLNYTLKDRLGNVIDESSDGNFSYLHGAGNIIPGLERELSGKAAGDNFSVEISPEDAYGPHDQSLRRAVSREMFAQNAEVEVGSRFQAESQDGQKFTVTIVEVNGDEVVVDANHPLAGVPLHFQVDVISVRPASDTEIAHGHVHAPGQHDH